VLTIAGANPSPVVRIPASSQTCAGLVVISVISRLKHSFSFPCRSAWKMDRWQCLLPLDFEACAAGPSVGTVLAHYDSILVLGLSPKVLSSCEITHHLFR